MMSEQEKTFYIRINNPSGLRKELLEGSKEVISVLRTYDNINAIRKEKIENIVELNKVLGDIKKLNSILKEKLPLDNIGRTNNNQNIKKRVVKKKQPKKETLVEKVPVKQTKEIQKLEDELTEIEERLSKLGV